MRPSSSAVLRVRVERRLSCRCADLQRAERRLRGVPGRCQLSPGSDVQQRPQVHLPLRQQRRLQGCWETLLRRGLRRVRPMSGERQLRWQHADLHGQSMCGMRSQRGLPIHSPRVPWRDLRRVRLECRLRGGSTEADLQRHGVRPVRQRCPMHVRSDAHEVPRERVHGALTALAVRQDDCRRPSLLKG